MTKGGVSSSGGDRRGGGGGDDTLQVAQLKERHHELDIDGGTLGRLHQDVSEEERLEELNFSLLYSYRITAEEGANGCNEDLDRSHHM
jgi:hypothetical protein